MEIDEYRVIELIKEQMEDQGCKEDSLETIRITQPHLYAWIRFFGLKEEDIK